MIRVLDMFCGAGGSSYGARMAGAEIAAGIDMDAVATRTFSQNFPQSHVVSDRLENVDLKKLRDHAGDIDLLLSSPECTNHTCAKGARPRSEESRATAMLVIDYLKAFKPRWFVMENVVHMRPWSRYGELKETLVDLGYQVGEQVIDASDHGVAQKRRRLFLVGDLEQSPNLVTTRKRGRRKTVAAILDRSGTWKTTPLYTERRAKDTLARAQRAMQALGEETRFLVVYYGSDGSGGWQRLDRPLRTITTVDRFALVEPGPDGPAMRMLQVPELRRAMGFLDDFTLEHGTRRDRIRLLGNGVCPPVMSEVTRALTR